MSLPPLDPPELVAGLILHAIESGERRSLRTSGCAGGGARAAGVCRERILAGRAALPQPNRTQRIDIDAISIPT